MSFYRLSEFLLWASNCNAQLFNFFQMHTGFFKCNVEKLLPHKPTVLKLVGRLGYKPDDSSKEHLIVGALDVDQLKQVSLCLFLVALDLEIIYAVAVAAEKEGVPLKKVIDARGKTIRGKDEALSLLKMQPDESTKKPRLDESATSSQSDGGRTDSKASTGSGSDDMLNHDGRPSSEDQLEHIQSSMKFAQRQTKYPPSDAFTTSGETAMETYESHNALMSVPFRPDQLTDEVLYGQEDHSAEVQAPGDQEVMPASELDALTQDSIRRGKSAKEENPLYMNLSSLPLPRATSLPSPTTHTPRNVTAWNTSMPEPMSPPPTYAQAMNCSTAEHDYVIIEDPQNAQDEPMTKVERPMRLDNVQASAPDNQPYGGGWVPSQPELLSQHDELYASRGTVRNGNLASGHPTIPVRTRPANTARNFQDESYTHKRSDGYDPGLYHSSGAPERNGLSNGGESGAPAAAHSSTVTRAEGDVFGKSGKSPCDYCAIRDGTHMCEGCFKWSCGKCERVISTDFCVERERTHKFVDIRRKKEKAFAERQPRASTSELPAKWNCARCTYENAGARTVCEMCSSTRAFAGPRLPESGRPICRRCRYANDEGRKVCTLCGSRCDGETFI